MRGELAACIEREGFAIVPQAVPSVALDTLLSELATLPLGAELRRRGGTRDLFESVPEVRELARSGAMREAAEAVLGPGCFAVRALLFDKTPDANWKVIWHQDLTIAVRERRTAAGFGPWSEKAGIPHVQPPVSLLERMVAVRPSVLVQPEHELVLERLSVGQVRQDVLRGGSRWGHGGGVRGRIPSPRPSPGGRGDVGVRD